MLAFFVGTASLALAQSLPAPRSTPPNVVGATLEGRRAELLRGLTAVNHAIRVRSLHELAAADLFDDMFCRALLRYAQEADDFDSLPVIPIVARASAKVVPAILDSMQNVTERFQPTLILSLGRIGPPAKQAVPALRGILAKEGLDEWSRISIRTALAEIGEADPENEAMLKDWLSKRTKEGQSVVGVLGLTGAQHWPGKDAVSLLSVWLDGTPSSSSASASLALASLGTNAVSSAAAIQKCLDSVDEQSSSLRILYGSSLSLIFEPGSVAQKKAYRDMLSYLGEAENRSDWPALSMVAHTLIDSNLFVQTIALIADTNASVAHGAIRMLAEVGKPSELAGSRMLNLMRKPPREVPRREEVAGALGFVLPAAAIRDLEQILATERDRQVREALENSLIALSLGNRTIGVSPQAALGSASDDSIVPILRGLRDLDTEYQSRQAIRRQGTNVLAKLIESTRSSEPELRAGAARGLSSLLLEAVKLSNEQLTTSVSALAVELTDPQSMVRVEAATALEYFAIYKASPDIAIPALQRSLEDPSARKNAATALGHYAGAAKEAVPALTKLLSDPDIAVRKSAAEGIGGIGPAAIDAVDALLIALKSDKSVQPSVAHALGEIGGKPEAVIPALVGLFGTDDPQGGVTSSFCASAVARYGAKALEYLMPGLGNSQAKIRYWTAVSMLQIGEQASGSLEALEKVLTDPDPDVRRIAQMAVEKIRQPKPR